MDRAVSSTLQQRRLVRQIALWVGALALLALAVFAFRSSLRSSVKRSQVRTAVAELGAVENTLTASGLILPEFEEIIVAPVSAAIQRVLVTEGAQVVAGQPLLELDKELLILEAEKLKDELALRRNKIEKLRYELQKSFFDLQINDSIKALRISSLEADLDNTKRLERVGGATKEGVNQADLDLRIARLEKRQLENDLKVKQQTMEAELRESELQAQIQERSLREMERTIQQTVITARRSGVITWINQQIGSGIQKDQQLVKIADLGSYRVEGAVADLYAERVQVGLPVMARINDTLITGIVSNVRPTVENDILTFDVRLDNPRHPLLRPSLRVEVFLITESRNEVVRVANGPVFDGSSILELFVVEGDKARRRRVPIGLSNFDYVELRDQINPGEEIIISDMSDYEHVREIRLVK